MSSTEIERSLNKLLARQEQICDRISRIEAKLGGAGASGNGVPGEELIRFLDAFRAGESLGAASLGAWIEVCETPCLRGGLRTIQGREAMHARLLEERILELGGAPKAETPEALYRATMKSAGSTSKSDADKLDEFLTQFPDIDVALKPIYEMADRLDDDLESQALLRTIAQDERATLEFLAEARSVLAG